MSEPTDRCNGCDYSERAWRAETALAVRTGLRTELKEALGVADAYGDQALEEALRMIARLKAQAAKWEGKAKARPEGVL